MQILVGVPRGGGVKQGWGGENKLFSGFMRRYLVQSPPVVEEFRNKSNEFRMERKVQT